MKALVAYNPFSRHNKIEKNINLIKRTLHKRYQTIDFYKSDGVKTITAYVKDNVNNYDLLIISGGDGTINEAINGYLEAKSETPISIIPSGTVNDLSHLLGYKKNIKKSLFNIMHGRKKKMDVCKMNDVYFTYASAIGKYTNVSYSAKRGMKRIFGPLAYLFQGIHEFYKYTRLDLKIKADDKNLDGSYYVVFLLNTARVAGFMIDHEHKTKLNDNLIELTLIDKAVVTWPRLMKFFLFGNKNRKGIHTVNAAHIEIESNEILDINTDGELALSVNKVNVDVIHNGINVIVPRDIAHKYFIREKKEGIKNDRNKKLHKVI